MSGVLKFLYPATCDNGRQTQIVQPLQPTIQYELPDEYQEEQTQVV